MVQQIQQSHRLLSRALGWIGEGPHFDLLNTILPLNGSLVFDPVNATLELFHS